MSYVLNEFQIKWLADLKAGRFLQMTGFLGSNIDGDVNQYCCLGVACVVYNELATHDPIDVRTAPAGTLSFDGERFTLPLKAIRKLKLRTNDARLAKPYVKGDTTYPTLASMNDAGITHQEIAAYIEANLENVFV